MNNDEAIIQTEVFLERDPRTAPFGIFMGGSFVLDSVRVFAWFESIAEMQTYLMEIFPRCYDIEDQEDLQAYQERVRLVVESLATSKLTDSSRAEFNSLVSDFAVADWWGEFKELTDGNSEFANRLRARLFEDESEGEGEDGPSPILSVGQLDDFVEFLKTCGV